MKTQDLVNCILERLSDYVSRITAINDIKGRSLSKNEYTVD